MNVIEDALVDRTVEGAPPLTRFQFERQGYFCVDFDSSKEKVLNLFIRVPAVHTFCA